MKKIVCSALIAVVSLSASAQMRKCIGSDGKVQYSDTFCPNTSVEKSVRTDGVSTLDNSGLRSQGQKMVAEESRQSSIAAQQPKPRQAQPTDRCEPLKGKARIDCLVQAGGNKKVTDY